MRILCFISAVVVTLGACGDADGGSDATDSASDSDIAADTDEDGADDDRPSRLAHGDADGATLDQPSAVTEAFELRFNDTLRTTLPMSAIQLGVVDALDDMLNYDPYFLEPGSDIDSLYREPDGLRFESPTALVYSAETSTFALTFASGTANLTVTAVAADRFRFQLVPADDFVGAPVFLRVTLDADSEEGFYGLGEVFDDVNHRGKVRAMQFEPTLIESGYNEAHVPVPFLIGTTGWATFFESYRPGVFSVASDDATTVRVTFGLGNRWSDGMTWALMAEAHPLDLVAHLYDETGAFGAVSPSALGPWIWRDEVPGQAEVEADMWQIRDLDLATTGYWIDRPYASSVNSFDFKPSDYPDIPAMFGLAEDLGLAMALWHTPYVDADEPSSAELSAHAEAQGFFAPVTGPTALANWGPPIDFTNPDAVTWWKELLEDYRALGVEGYKLDYAEEVVVGIAGRRLPWRFFNGEDELTMHRGYQNVYHQPYDEVMPDDGGFLLCRASAFGGQTRGIIIWPGDIDAGFERYGETYEDIHTGESFVAVGGLPAAIIAGSSLGASGFPLFAADTGGYRHSPPAREPYIRWIQQSALSPAMQVGTNTNDLPWSLDDVFDQELVDMYRRYARLHLRLFPYLWSELQALRDHGRPIQRPLGLAHPELNAHPNFVYLLGDDLLVTPVVDEGVREVSLELPAGNWHSWWTGRRYSGSATVPAPLLDTPMLVREGAVIPLLRPTIDTIKAPAAGSDVDAFETTPHPLWLVATAGPDSQRTLYDGTTVDQSVTGELAQTIRVTRGDVFDGPFVVEVIAVPQQPLRIDVDGEPLERAADGQGLEQGEMVGWAYRPGVRGDSVFVRPPADAVSVTISYK